MSESSLYIYAIAAEPIMLDDLSGIGQEPLTSIAVGTCHVITGQIATEVSPDADTLRAQDALVRQLAARTDALLPARFGSRFADVAAAHRAIEPLTSGLEQALARVRGCEQMTVRLFVNTHTNTHTDTPRAAVAEDVQGGPGTQYMRRRAAEARQATEAFDLVHGHMAAHVKDERIEHGRPPVIGSIHHLIPRGTADAYRARLGELATRGMPAVRMRVSGPSPGYAFAEVIDE